MLHAVDTDLLMPVANKYIVRPSEWVQALCEIAVAIAGERGERAPVDGVAAGDRAKAIATSLMAGERKAICSVTPRQHPQAAQLRAWAQWIAKATGAAVGVLTEAANTVGGYVVSAYPRHGGLNALEMIAQPRKAYVLWNVEPDYDLANPAAAAQALQAAETVIACSVYRNGALDYADVILPITPFTETAGTFINCEGRVQSFNDGAAGRRSATWLESIAFSATCWAWKVSSTRRPIRCAVKRYRSMSVRCSRMKLRSRPRNRSVQGAGERGGKITTYLFISPMRSCAARRRYRQRTMQGGPRRARTGIR